MAARFKLICRCDLPCGMDNKMSVTYAGVATKPGHLMQIVAENAFLKITAKINLLQEADMFRFFSFCVTHKDVSKVLEKVEKLRKVTSCVLPFFAPNSSIG